MKKQENNTLAKAAVFGLLLLAIGSGSMSAQALKSKAQYNNGQEELSVPKNDNLKAQWIMAHPDEYKRMGGQIEEKRTQPVMTIDKEGQQGQRKQVHYPAPEVPGFPAYVNTGNRMVDDENYAVQKQLWISINKSQYDAMNKTPNTGKRTEGKTGIILNDNK